MEQERDRPWVAILQVPAELPRLLRDPGGVGAGGAPGEVEAPGAELEEDKDVQSLEEDRVDGVWFGYIVTPCGLRTSWPPPRRQRPGQQCCGRVTM
jgi:hypothetical protein